MYVCRNDRNVCIYIRIYILWISFLDERVSESGFARFDAEHYGTCFEIFWFQMLRWPQNGSRQRMKRKLHFGVRSQISVACHRIFPLVKCYTSSFLLSHTKLNWSYPFGITIRWASFSQVHWTQICGDLFIRVWAQHYTILNLPTKLVGLDWLDSNRL